MMRRTKIVCTLGPASRSRETISAMIRAGMDVARLNTSHGTIDEHIQMLDLVRKVARDVGKHVGVLMDLGGPKLRTGDVPDGIEIPLSSGATVMLAGDGAPSRPDRISVPYPAVAREVQPRDPVLIDDGAIELEVIRPRGDMVECEVVTGGLLGAQKGVSFPQSPLTLAALTPRDRAAIAAGVAAGVDFVALSFVRDAEDIVLARAVIHGYQGDIPIVAKIERRQAVKNLDAILAEADGAMVARGDLGVELPPEDVPVLQRDIIASAGRNMIPVITATQMLQSMVESPRPTRAESSDVANAVWDLSDALMLSGETAIGQYPVAAVAMMDRIIRKAEESAPPSTDGYYRPGADNHSYTIALAASRAVDSDENMRGVACFTRSGYTAFLMSKVHPNAPIYGFSPSVAVCRRLSLARGVSPILAPLVETSEEMLAKVDQILVEERYATSGEEVVVVASLPVRSAGTTNFLTLHSIGESEAYS